MIMNTTAVSDLGKVSQNARKIKHKLYDTANVKRIALVDRMSREEERS